MKLSSKQKSQLWWLIISCDHDYDRIIIAEHELDDENLTLWLEDKNDFKNSLDECVEVTIPVKDLAKFIKTENFNSYEGEAINGRTGKLCQVRIEINEPITWYNSDASLTEQQLVRVGIVKKLLTILVEDECVTIDDFNRAA